MNKIRAQHKTDWTGHPGCKFQPNQRVKVIKESYLRDRVSKRIQARGEQHGNVIGVSVAADGLIRGRASSGRRRDFTRYFVQFADGYVAGIDPRNLEVVD